MAFRGGKALLEPIRLYLHVTTKLSRQRLIAHLVVMCACNRPNLLETPNADVCITSRPTKIVLTATLSLCASCVTVVRSLVCAAILLAAEKLALWLAEDSSDLVRPASDVTGELRRVRQHRSSRVVQTGIAVL